MSGNWNGALERATLSYLAIKPYPFSFNTGYLGNGLIPLAAGYIAHKMATKFGLNKLVAKLDLPVEI